MAQNATIHKVRLQVADLDRHYYATHALTLARHPSETDERLMVRLLAFALHAGPLLSFTKGLSTEDEPDLWQKDLTGLIELWVEVGQPDTRRVRKACNRARRVVLYTYGRAAEVWWAQHCDDLMRFENLSVNYVVPATSSALAALVDRNMELQCTVQEGQVWFGDETRAVQLDVRTRCQPQEDR